MALVFRRNQVGVQPVGVSVTIPDDCRAKLMYYLECMCVVLSLENKGYDLHRLTNYQKYYLLTTVEEEVLLLLCLKLSPDVMEGKCIFLNEDACGEKDNQFVSLQAVSTTVAAVETVVVGERQIKVRQVMFYKLSWIQRNFFAPLLLLSQRVKNARQNPAIGGANQRPAITYGQSTSRQLRSPSSYSRSNECCCTIL